MRGVDVNKKGQQMTLGTIIAIVLGLVVLVFLIFGFTKGWGNLWDNISNLGGGDSNVDAVINGCELACASENTNAYCVQVRKVKYGDEMNTVHEGSCYALSKNETSSGMIDVPSCSISCEGKPTAIKLM